jgi:hypothetical protein
MTKLPSDLATWIHGTLDPVEVTEIGTLGERRKKEQGQFSIFQWWMAYSGMKIVI